MGENKYKEYVITEIYHILEGLSSELFMKAVELWGLDYEQDLFEKIMEQIDEETENPDVVMDFYEKLKELSNGE